MDAMVIVGAGEAGARAAVALRENGHAGPVTLVGDEVHFPYERPPLSKAAISGEAEPDPALILDAARLAAQGITHLAGVAVTAIDRPAHAVQLEDGRRLPYARLLLATGARPRRLSIPGAGPDNVLYLRNFADALALRARLRRDIRLVVIGGGFIGLEIAAAAVERGCAVTVVEMAPRILGRAVPAEVAAVVAARHREAGIRLIVGVGIDRIERSGSRERPDETVTLADGTRLDCDAIVAGIGAIPETALAEAAGLAIENGIRVDGRLVTSDLDILAAGDCCSFPHPVFDGRRLRLEAWRNAQDQGSHAARSMLGATGAYDRVPWFWSDQHDHTLQIAGLPDEADSTVLRGSAEAPLYFHLKAGRLVGASGVGPDGRIGREIRLAEMLIQQRAHPDPALLANPAVKLKSLLASV